MGSKDQNSTFSEHGHVAYQIKGNPEFSNMVANTLLTDPPTIGIKRWKFNFSEQCHVLSNYGNHECSNMVANILPVDPLNPGGQKVKIQLFQNMVMLHIKSKEITNAATC